MVCADACSTEGLPFGMPAAGLALGSPNSGGMESGVAPARGASAGSSIAGANGRGPNAADGADVGTADAAVSAGADKSTRLIIALGRGGIAFGAVAATALGAGGGGAGLAEADDCVPATTCKAGATGAPEAVLLAKPVPADGAWATEAAGADTTGAGAAGSRVISRAT